MSGRGGETELTAFLPTKFGALVSQREWTMRTLILDDADLGINARRPEVVVGWTQTLHSCVDIIG